MARMLKVGRDEVLATNSIAKQLKMRQYSDTMEDININTDPSAEKLPRNISKEVAKGVPRSVISKTSGNCQEAVQEAVVAKSRTGIRSESVRRKTSGMSQLGTVQMLDVKVMDKIIPRSKSSIVGSKLSGGAEVKEVKEKARVVPTNDTSLYLETLIERVDHEGVLKYGCKNCGKSLPRKAKMKSHVEVHLDILHPCNLCDTICKTCNALSIHYVKKHGQRMPHSWH